MESPVLQNSTVVEKQSRKKLYLSLAVAFFILATAFLLVVVFTFGKSNQKSPAPTFNDPEPVVSAPGVAVGEPNPNTPIPIETDLTYKFPAASGFNITYPASDWTVVNEPTQVNNYGPDAFTFDSKNLLKFQSTIDPNADIQIYFTKAVSGMLNGNPLIVCNSEYKIIKELSAPGTNDGLIRLYQGDSGTLIYSNNYYQSTENPSEMCVFNSHPIFKVEFVDGGDTGTVPDTNDIYWIVTVFTKRGNSQLEKIDEIVKTISFVQF